MPAKALSSKVLSSLPRAQQACPSGTPWPMAGRRAEAGLALGWLTGARGSWEHVVREGRVGGALWGRPQSAASDGDGAGETAHPCTEEKGIEQTQEQNRAWQGFAAALGCRALDSETSFLCIILALRKRYITQDDKNRHCVPF